MTQQCDAIPLDTDRLRDSLLSDPGSNLGNGAEQKIGRTCITNLAQQIGVDAVLG
jgi:hypothetical protein